MFTDLTARRPEDTFVEGRSGGQQMGVFRSWTPSDSQIQLEASIAVDTVGLCPESTLTN
jgi:hypothetical protein